MTERPAYVHDGQPHIEKCANFQRTPTGIYEVQKCLVLDREVNCGGFSDGCINPSVFVAQRGMPNRLVLFDISLVKDLGRKAPNERTDSR